MADLSSIKAEALRAEMKPKKCEKCEAKDKANASPIQAMLAKLSNLGLPSGCNCSKAPEGEAPKTVVLVAKPEEKKPLEEKPEAVSEQKKHHTSPFVQRCVAAITGGHPAGREEESGAFAKCVATQNKSHKDLDKSAKTREGFAARKKQFVQSLKDAKK